MSTLPSKLIENLTTSYHSATLAQVIIISFMNYYSRILTDVLASVLAHHKYILNIGTIVTLWKHESDNTLLKILQQFTISLIVKTNILVMTFKALQDLAPVPSLTSSPYCSPPHSILSSHTSLLAVPWPHKVLPHVRAFELAAPSTWNTLLLDIRMAHFLGLFNCHLLNKVILELQTSPHPPHMHSLSPSLLDLIQYILPSSMVHICLFILSIIYLPSCH